MFKKKLWLTSICVSCIIVGLVGCTPVDSSIRATTATSIPTTITASTTLSATTQTTTSTTITSSINDSIVQVWIGNSNSSSKTFEALGIAVGDGTTVMTIINYEDYTPGDGGIEVMTQNSGSMTATIQAIDARTGATLLKLDSGSLPPIATRDPATLKPNEQLIEWDMGNSDNVLEATDIIGPNVPPNASALDFNVGLPEGANGDGGGTQGALVVDQNGKVLGLESIWTYILVMRTGYPGYIPPIISIDTAAELLSPDANEQPWSNGPVLFADNVIVSGKGIYNGNYDGIDRDYAPVAAAITQTLNQLGGALQITDLPQNFVSYSTGNEATNSPDGSLITTVFPRLVNLCDSSGKILAQAKWVGIQWDRNNGNPSRVVYGSTAYTVTGSFEITGNTNSLESSVQTMVNDQIPYGQ